MSADQIPVHEGITQMFGRHFVALCFVLRGRNSSTGREERSVFTASGTILGVGSRVFFLTAGHVLKKVDTAAYSGSVQIESSRFVDIFASGNKTDVPIPFQYVGSPVMYVDQGGMDFGVIGLHRHVQRLLFANGILPIDDIQWKNTPTRFDRHMLMGLPQELSTDHLEDAGGIGLIPVVIRIEALAERPNGMEETPANRFYGRLPLGIPLQNLSGMSGGPMFGILDGPPMKYWAVALQSTWLRESGVVAACKISEIAEIIETWMRENDPEKRQAF
jgi:hypothetical protein